VHLSLFLCLTLYYGMHRHWRLLNWKRARVLFVAHGHIKKEVPVVGSCDGVRGGEFLIMKSKLKQVEA
jgi:hypothetical protein